MAFANWSWRTEADPGRIVDRILLGMGLLGRNWSVVSLCDLLVGEAIVGQPRTISDTIHLAVGVSVPHTVLRGRPAGSREAARPFAP